MRVSLGLTDHEIMNRPWIVTQIESADLPWYNSKKKDVVIIKKKDDARLDKYRKNIPNVRS